MIHFHAFDASLEQATALAQAVAQALGSALARTAATASHAAQPHEVEPAGDVARRSVTLAVSGGTSPRLFLQMLSLQPLDWARVQVMLVDERWVPESSDASNARLVRDTLLQHAAAAARFVPLAATEERSLDEQIAWLNDHAPQPDVVVLGMGEDGHTASLFADAPEWAYAIATNARFVSVHPGAAPHARVSLSLDALVNTPSLFLQISGARKREVLETACAAPQQNAISQLAHDTRTTLDVYWSI